MNNSGSLEPLEELHLVHATKRFVMSFNDDFGWSFSPHSLHLAFEIK